MVESILGVSRYKLLYVGGIDHKVLPDSTENWIQNPRINHNRKKYFLKRMYN